MPERATPSPSGTAPLERYVLERVEEDGRSIWRLVVVHTGEICECKGFMPLALGIIEREVGGSALLAVATHVAEEVRDLTDIAIEHEECTRG